MYYFSAAFSSTKFRRPSILTISNFLRISMVGISGQRGCPLLFFWHFPLYSPLALAAYFLWCRRVYWPNSKCEMGIGDIWLFLNTYQLLVWLSPGEERPPTLNTL